MPFPDDTVHEAERLVRRYPVARSALLPLLHLLQSVEGHVSEDGITFCAELLSLTKAEVGAVATFYTMYKREPFGDHLLSVCTNPPCQLAGSQEIYDGYVEACGGDIDRDGSGVMVEHAECLGICDAAPVVQINYENYKPDSKEHALQLLEQAKAGEPPASNLTDHVPATFREVERELSGIDDGVDDHLIEAAKLQVAAATAPTYRSGETALPVTHPGVDPSGHGGDVFRNQSHIGVSPLREQATEQDRRVAEELSDELRGEAAQLAEHVAGAEDDQPVPSREDQPPLTDEQVATATGELGASQVREEPADLPETAGGDAAEDDRDQSDRAGPSESDPSESDRSRSEASDPEASDPDQEV